MRGLHRKPHLAFRLALPFVALLTLVACGGGATPSQPQDGVLMIAGRVALPAGHGLDLTRLTVITPLGSVPVSAAGEFSASVFAGAVTELDVEAGDGRLLIIGLTNGAQADASFNSTARALLYYLVGGVWLPGDKQDKVRSLLADAPEVGIIAGELERQLLAGRNGLTDPDAVFLAALGAARAAVLGDAAVAALSSQPQELRYVSSGTQPGSWLVSAATDSSNIVIDPTKQQAGVQVLQNPTGAGVVAQNSYRRPAALLAYETSWEDADGVETPVDPPLFTERVEVPATEQLELLNAIGDVLTGDAPWTPVLSPALRLAGHAGASRTHYQLLLVGPSVTDVTWPIMNDARFTGMHDEWDAIVLEKSVDLVLNQLLLPLMEVYGLGSMAKLDAAKLNKMRERVRMIHDQHLMQLGVYLKQGKSGYASGLKFLIEELAQNKTYRIDMIGMLREALQESDKNKSVIEAMERRLSGRASATAITAAVQAVLVGGDVARIMYDLNVAPSVVDWTAVAAPALFALSPASAVVTRADASARFTVLPKGQTTGNYRYRWTTSGTFGELSDFLGQKGKSFDTSERQVEYFHNYPINIKDTDVDTIGVEVFEIPAGATSIPAGSAPIARMAAEVRGDDRNLDSRIEVDYGVTPIGMYEIDDAPFQAPCAQMTLRFKAEPGAKSYTVYISGVGGQGDGRNLNQDFRSSGYVTVFIDPNAQYNYPGWRPDYYGVCEWRNAAGLYGAAPQRTGARFDREKNEYRVSLFAADDFVYIIAPGEYDVYPLDEQVPLWYDWVDGATFDVEVNR